MAKRVIAVDLDGTLAEYDGWKGMHHIGLIVPEVANAMMQAQREGADVYIFTARVSDPAEAVEAGQVIDAWMRKHELQHEGITAVKHKFFTEFWDDRAIQVIRNQGIFVVNEHTDAMCLNDGPDDHQLTKQERHDIDVHLNEEHKQLFTPVDEEPRTPSSALDVQVGGDHYKKWKIQPIEFAHANNMPFLDANAFKYICRHADKNGVQDLRKAKHYLELIAEMVYGEKL